METIGKERSGHWVPGEAAPLLIQMNRLRKVPNKVTRVHSMPLLSSHSLNWLLDAPQTPRMSLPQGQCTCCFLCLECSYPNGSLSLIPSNILLMKTSLDILFFQNSLLNFLSLLYFAAELFSPNILQIKLLFAFFTRV